MINEAKTDKQQIKTGIIWNAIQLIVNQSFTFIVKLVLLKLLLPSQFGIIGMATVFSGLMQVINDLGINAALVQRKDKELTRAHFDTAFWTGIIWSATLYIIVSFAVGPLAAYYYHEPMLNTIIPVISLAILINPVNLVHKAQLTRAMNFKRIALIDNTANILAGITAIGLALAGFGIWALVFNTVAIYAIAMPLYYKATGWLPKLQWNKQAFKDVFGFGAYTTGANVFTYFYNNIDYLLIGRLLGATLLGTYTFAFVVTDTFRSRIMAVVNNVMYPIYGKKQDDPELLKRYYLRVVQINCLFVFPIMLFFTIFADSFILQIFGEKWRSAIMPLRFLSISVMFQIMVSGNTALIRGLGKPGLDMKLQMIKAAIFVPTLAYATIKFGIIGAAVAIVFNKFLLVVIAQYTFKYLLTIKISTMELLQSLKPCLIALVAATGVGLLSNYLHITFFVGAPLLFITYFALIWLFIGNELKRLFLKKN
ncbi:lipopolysaccharide biosynthesis protein [Mucilaginibacter sp. JRF]|nr:lipopolysaccharide biosynthesis protein [Mucilaginibacter sp. JRF]